MGNSSPKELQFLSKVTSVDRQACVIQPPKPVTCPNRHQGSGDHEIGATKREERANKIRTPNARLPKFEAYIRVHTVNSILFESLRMLVDNQLDVLSVLDYHLLLKFNCPPFTASQPISRADIASAPSFILFWFFLFQLSSPSLTEYCL